MSSSTVRGRLKSSRSRSSSYNASPELDNAQLRITLAFEEIFKATGNFSHANKIGEGGFGTVYKGKLKNGSFVAVKRARKVRICYS